MSSPTILILSPILKGLNIEIKSPLNILANDSCAAKPIIAAAIPEPASTVPAMFENVSN